jgi:hypothetical protein
MALAMPKSAKNDRGLQPLQISANKDFRLIEAGDAKAV